MSVINDLVTDNRVKKTCEILLEKGYDVKLIGRELPDSLPLPQWPYKALRMKLLFKKGPLFYLFFNIRLFFVLLVSKADLLFSNDLDTLLPNFLAARIKNIPLIYDSHELFCEVPELQHAPLKKRIWECLEKSIVPRLKFCITVNDSIARIFTEKYAVKFHVIRNIPAHTKHHLITDKTVLQIPDDKKIIVLQGAGINIDRGAEELVEAMVYVNDAILLIIGGGDVWEILEEKVRVKNLGDKVRLIKKIPREQLMAYTAAADLGLTIDKNTNPNYYYSLPNKLFDYIHAGTPVLASRLPEIEKIITEYQVGEFIGEHDPAHIAGKINDLLKSERLHQYASNTVSAALELNWEKEKKKYLAILEALPA